jgi:hypothetical protein
MKIFFCKSIFLLFFCISCTAKDREYIEVRDFILYKDTLLNQTISVAAVITSSAPCTLPGNKNYYCLVMTGNNATEYFFIRSDSVNIKQIVDWKKNNTPLKLVGKVEMMDDRNISGETFKTPTLVITKIIPLELEEKISAPFKIAWKPILAEVIYIPYVDNDASQNPMESLVFYNEQDIFYENNTVSIWVRYELKNPKFIKKGPIKNIFLRYKLGCEIDEWGSNARIKIVTASFFKPNENEILFTEFNEKDIEPRASPFELYRKLRRVTEGYCGK